MSPFLRCSIILPVFLTAVLLPLKDAQGQDGIWGDALKGSGSYDDFEKPERCASCHVDIARQYEQAMMSRAYTHSWDEIEYFKLAVPHAEKDPKFKDAVDGCNGCHAPLAYIAGDIPPPRPYSGSRADESVSCDACHTITGSGEDPPYNYSFTIEPGRAKRGNREGVDSPHHLTIRHDFTMSTELCGTCHNEKNPFDVWVKSTQMEWQEGPYAADGVRCQDCHMPPARSRNSIMSKEYDDVAQHLFTGAHSPGRLAGAVEVAVYPDVREVVPGERIKITVACYNHKAGHKIPTGSVEERQLWLTVTAVDAEGKSYHLPVDKKGFDGEEYTISSNELAFQDMGYMLDDPEFEGLSRDALPYEGDRVFRMPYFDPEGRMTIAQWNTARLGTDYRIGPRETRMETYTWKLPDDLPLGTVRIVAEMQYRRLIKSVGEYLGVPDEEMKAEFINRAESSFDAVDY
ncbi:MAG: hypothetical protein KFH87_08590 [Bacteroidetes bacterium]|nr:hypothetical protein [Bacteroidota bacterium]